MDRRDSRSWRGAICFAVLVAVFAPGPVAAVGPDEVYATLDLAEHCADLLLEDQGLMGIETIDLVEHELGPMHIYQMAVATIDRMIAFCLSSSTPWPAGTGSPPTQSMLRRFGWWRT